MKNASVFKHTESIFRVGERVLVTQKIEAAEGWGDSWIEEMDDLVGKEGEVISSKHFGVVVEFYSDASQRWCFPSCALAISQGGNVTTPAAAPAQAPAPATSAPAKPKRKSRVGPGPWDQAPCTHLRWHLMGFFREKLALVKAVVDIGLPDGSIQQVSVAAMDVVCTKCGVKMTLNAK